MVVHRDTWQTIRRVLSSAVAIVAVAVLAPLPMAAPSQASERLLLGFASGSQETPPNAATSRAEAVVTVDPATNRIDWIIYHDVSAPLAAHFHGNGFPGVAATILVDLGGLSGGLTSPMVGSTTRSAQDVADLLAGRWYVNIHSVTFSGGEIRGQLAVVGGNAPVTLFPGSGAHLARTTGFDLTVFLRPGAAPVSATVKVDGADVTAPVLGCVHVGTLVGGGFTLRCPVPGGVLAPGPHFVSLVVSLSDSTSVGSTATWFVDDSTEP